MLWKLSLLFYLNIICVKCSTISDVTYWRVRYIMSSEESIETDNPIKPKHTVKNLLYPKEDRHTPSVHEYHPTITTTMAPIRDYTTRISMRKNSNLNEKFSAKFHPIMAKQFSAENLIYSPISLQSLLAILYLGAEHTTAMQLQTALELPESLPNLLDQFQSIMSETQRTSKNFHLNFAQKIYFKNKFVLLYGIEDMAKSYLKSEVAPISFDSPVSAAEEINHWIAKKTHNRITNIVKPDSFDADTELVLVNSIYLKAKWAREFSTSDTLKQEFFIEKQSQPITVDMMYIEDDFKYGDFPELDAKIVELPFLDSELSMLVILPNEIDGLASMERRLGATNLNRLLENLQATPLTFRMPKFKIESDLDMEDPLKKIGIQNIFTNNAELGKLFSNPNVKVSKVQHKAFIDVNEGGVEAAAATFVQISPLSLQPNMVYLSADHPFMFAIRSPQAVYFIGHVINNFQ